MHLIDLGVLGENLVGQFLGRGQHFRVVHGDEILHKLLQLVPVHLE